MSRFTKANSAPKPRIIGLSTGEVGSAKTSFWLSAPGPIVVLSFDQGLEGVVEKFQADKEILVREYEWAPTEDTGQDEAIELRDQFVEDYEAAVQNARTVVVDKSSQLWELYRYAEFGGPSEAPRNYASLNQRMRKLFNMPKSYDCNAGFIDGMKDEWGSAKKEGGGTKGVQTGRRVRKGFDEADELVHVTLHHVREDGSFKYTVGKSRGPGAGDVQDQTFEISDPTTAFAELGQLLFPDSSESDWT
jgi:hypothetical protein